MSYSEATVESHRLIGVETLAAMLDVSKRHIYRLSDSGRMPKPFKLGKAIRWDRDAIERWIESGCLPSHPSLGGKR